METNQNETKTSAGDVYAYAAHLLVNQKMNSEETRSALIEKGLDPDNTTTVVDGVQTHIQNAKKEKAKKDMLYGALWCVGGIVATMANIGFIFWGAIIFGAIQFFKGLSNA